jgi:hypothetical protein
MAMPCHAMPCYAMEEYLDTNGSGRDWSGKAEGISHVPRACVPTA